MRINAIHQILLTSIFTFSNGLSGPMCIAQNKDLQWNALGEGLNGSVNVMLSDGNDLYVGGNFFNAGGIEDADHIARWDGTAWHALGKPPEFGAVHAIAKFGNDLYIGGDFTRTGDDPNARFIARWDGEAWHALGAGGHILNHLVWALAAFQDHLYIGGRFTNVAGIANGDHLIRWDGQQFSSVGGGITTLNNGVQTLVADENNLYVGGAFGQVGNVPYTRNLARWDGTNWHPLGEGFWGDMGALCIAIKGQDVYVGGDGGPIGVAACGVARWDGNEWHPMGDGLSHCIYGEGAYDIKVAGDSVFVCGNFADAGIDHTSSFAGWNGSEWFALGNPETEPYLVPYQGGAIWNIQPHGKDLYIGGLFTLTAGDVPIHNIARWGESKTTSISPLPDSHGISIEVFPSHTEGTFRYSFGHEETLHTMSILDAWGREVIRKTQSEMQGNIQSLPAGLYMLRIDLDGMSGVAKLIKI
jgi:hypothetical protein